MANDADIQGLGASQGKGVELIITLGTGVGSALVYEGSLIPNLELGNHPFRHGQTYEQQLGRPAYDRIGPRRWNTRIRRMVELLSFVFNYDELYLGGGNSKRVTRKLPSNVRVVSNECGLFGGVKLWNPHAEIKVPSLRVA